MLDGPGQYELFAIISHMGANTACGHYVAHIKKDGRWVQSHNLHMHVVACDGRRLLLQCVLPLGPWGCCVVFFAHVGGPGGDGVQL